MHEKTLRCIFFLGLLILIGAYKIREKSMIQLNYDLGKNIVETAKKSGAPHYNADNIVGFISYELDRIPTDVIVRFTRNNYEIEMSNVFGVSMYADEEYHNNLAVDTISIQFRMSSIKSHEEGKKYIYDLARQFNSKLWKRYIEDHCPAVTGKSAYLNENDQIKVFSACSIDPHFDIPLEDWIELTAQTSRFEWIGDGILATLTFNHTIDSQGLTYTASLEFDNFASKKRLEDHNQKVALAEGDKKGWHSTENYLVGLKSSEASVKKLEAKALQRGDQVVARK